MSPAPAKAAIGTMACWRAVRISDGFAAVVCVLVIPWDSCATAAEAFSANPTPRATASTPARPRLRDLSGVELFIGDFLQPGDVLPVYRAGNGEVGHRGGGGSAMPVLDARRAPNNVTGPDFLHGPAPFLGKSHTRNHQEMLSGRMRMPSRARTRLEGHQSARSTDVLVGRPDRIDPRPAGEKVGWTFDRRLAARAGNLLGTIRYRLGLSGCGHLQG